MAPSTTTKIVEEFSGDYDTKVMSWSGDISKVDESNILYILHLLQNSTIQTAMSPEQNTAGYDLFSDDWSSSSSTYSVGDISSITGASSDDIACLDDIQEGDYECEDFDEIDVSEDTVS